MELSLERYRFAALPNKFKERSEDKKLQPRVSLKLFPGTQILINVSFSWSTSWPQNFTLILPRTEKITSLRFFQDKINYQRLLNQWYGNTKQNWRLIYRASTHGYSSEAFHKYCDGAAPTYVIILVSNLTTVLILLDRFTFKRLLIFLASWITCMLGILINSKFLVFIFQVFLQECWYFCLILEKHC